ncbi:MAG: hypothetical protein PHN75_13295 [Syntrophales bacterium]|nr:hypothetical protein [Syntrophales bacterium]
MEKTDKKCKCGCGQIIVFKPHHKHRDIKYIAGHGSRGIERNDNWRTKIGTAAIKRHFADKMRPEICRMYIGESMTAKAIAKKLGTNRDVIVKRLKEEGIEIRGTGVFNGTEKYRRGIMVSDETRVRLSEARKANFRDPEYLKRFYKSMNISPNKPEKKILSLLENLYPGEWKYTGDFSFAINGKCPDFTNCNGQKKVIELYGDYWHRGQNPQDRIDAFKPFGFDTLVIWERELKNMESVKNKIQEFHKQ